MVKFTAWPFLVIFKTIFYHLFLLLYKLKRQIKKIFLPKLDYEDRAKKKNFSLYLPFVILFLISSLGIISNLQAKEIRPEVYGQNNLLSKIIQPSELYDEEQSAEVKEGPLPTEFIPTLYFEGEVLAPYETTLEKKENVDSLVATTNDESTLISPEITDPSIISKKRNTVIDYVVQSSDTISTIAQKFGISTNTILWENNLSYYSLIKPGQTLKILPVDGISYKIKQGDSLGKIAKTYQGKTEEIIEFNKLASATDIQTGQSIIIPNGVKPVAASAKTSASLKDIFTPAPASSAKLLWPTNSHRITQYFRWRHSGLDIGNKTGQPVYASEAGKVEIAGWNRGGYGYYIMINHGNGIETLYAHLSKIYAKSGKAVSRGEVIGTVGSTGRSSGPHLHFEVIVNGRRHNPLDWIR